MRKKCEGFPIEILISLSPRKGVNREIRDAFRVHFCDCFIRCPDLPLQEFCSYLGDLPRLGAAEAACGESVITGCEVRDGLKQVGFNKSLELDGLRYKCT